MLNSIRHTKIFSIPALPWIAGALAACLAGWLLYCNNGRVNSDGILYLEVAHLFAKGEWKAASHLFAWPLYSAMIAGVSQMTGLSLQMSGHMLTLIFFPVTAYALISLISAAGGQRKEILAGMALLFSSIYLMRDMLPMLVRDQGFWACHTLSLLYLLRFLADNSWKQAFGWGLTAITATLFRIEGLAFLAMLPLVIVLDPSDPFSTRLKRLFKCMVLPIATAACIATLLLSRPELGLSDLGRLGDPLIFLNAAIQNMTHGLHIRAERMSDVVLTRFLDDYAMLGIILTLFAALIGKTAGVMGWVSTFLAALAISKVGKTTLTTHAHRLLLWWLAVSMMICMVVLMAQFLLPARYAMPGGFALTVLGAFGLARLYRDRQNHRARAAKHGWVLPVLLLVLCVKFLYIVVAHDSRKNYEKDAVAWTLAHATPQSRIFYDDAKLRFYAGLPFTDRETGWTHMQVRGESLDSYDFAVVRVSRQKPEFLEGLLQQYPLHPLQEFEDTAGNKIVILGRRDGTGNAPSP